MSMSLLYHAFGIVGFQLRTTVSFRGAGVVWFSERGFKVTGSRSSAIKSHAIRMQFPAAGAVCLRGRLLTV